MKTMEQLKKELSNPLPAMAISQHPTKTYLSSIKAIYVTERLNDVFGIGKWQTRVEEVVRGDKGMVVVKVTLTIPDYDIYYESYGGNDNGGENSKNFDLGDAYKGATTDALTKIGSFLEIGIDVFKGKIKNTPAVELPWLSDKQFDEMKKAITDGKKDAVKAAMDKYRIKKDFREELEKML